MNFIRYLSPSHVPGPLTMKGVSTIQRETLLQFILNLLLGVGLLSLPWTISATSNARYTNMLSFYFPALVLLALLTLIRALNFYVRTGLIIALFYSAGTFFLVTNGVNGGGILLLLFTTVLANFLLEFQLGMVVFSICAATILMVGRAMVLGDMPLPKSDVTLLSSSEHSWITLGVIFLISGIVTVVAAWINNRGVVRALDAQRRLTDQVERERAELESRTRENSANFRKRLSQFEVASQIARDISTETNLQALLQNAVNMVRDRFGFYHAGIFFNDERNEYAVLRAATGEAGRQMLQNNHRLKIGETGLVGYAASRGEPRISENVSGDTVHYKNPLLPETRSEIALPLILGGRILGALDVQSVVEDAFMEEDVRILQTVADQLSVAMDKTRLLQQLQENVEELETRQKEATRKVWQTHLRNARRKFAYRYCEGRLEMDVPETPQAAEAMESGQPVIKTVSGSQSNPEQVFTTLAVPIKIRNQVLGVVDIEFERAAVSPDMVALIEGTVNRLAVSLENARLLEEIQYRAERERLVGEITSRVRASAEVENILRITAQELGRSLGVSEVMVQLRQSGQS